MASPCSIPRATCRTSTAAATTERVSTRPLYGLLVLLLAAWAPFAAPAAALAASRPAEAPPTSDLLMICDDHTSFQLAPPEPFRPTLEAQDHAVRLEADGPHSKTVGCVMHNLNETEPVVVELQYETQDQHTHVAIPEAVAVLMPTWFVLGPNESEAFELNITALPHASAGDARLKFTAEVIEIAGRDPDGRIFAFAVFDVSIAPRYDLLADVELVQTPVWLGRLNAVPILLKHRSNTDVAWSWEILNPNELAADGLTVRVPVANFVLQAGAIADPGLEIMRAPVNGTAGDDRVANLHLRITERSYGARSAEPLTLELNVTLRLWEHTGVPDVGLSCPTDLGEVSGAPDADRSVAFLCAVHNDLDVRVIVAAVGIGPRGQLLGTHVVAVGPHGVEGVTFESQVPAGAPPGPLSYHVNLELHRYGPLDLPGWQQGSADPTVMVSGYGEPNVVLKDAGHDLEPGAEQTVDIEVENKGTVTDRITVHIDNADELAEEGIRLDWNRSVVDLAPGQSAIVPLTVGSSTGLMWQQDQNWTLELHASSAAAYDSGRGTREVDAQMDLAHTVGPVERMVQWGTLAAIGAVVTSGFFGGRGVMRRRRERRRARDPEVARQRVEQAVDALFAVDHEARAAAAIHGAVDDVVASWRTNRFAPDLDSSMPMSQQLAAAFAAIGAAPTAGTAAEVAERATERADLAVMLEQPEAASVEHVHTSTGQRAPSVRDAEMAANASVGGVDSSSDSLWAALMSEAGAELGDLSAVVDDLF